MSNCSPVSWYVSKQVVSSMILAYADLLQAAGRPTLIILDDALVHSDNQRLDDMKRILFDASRRHQVLLFTCHADKWQDLGVPVRQMQQLARGT